MKNGSFRRGNPRLRHVDMQFTLRCPHCAERRTWIARIVSIQHQPKLVSIRAGGRGFRVCTKAWGKPALRQAAMFLLQDIVNHHSEMEP